MFSVSPAEILTIAVVALLVFGPKRLPEIARKTGKALRHLRNAASELTAGLEDEYRETLEPFKDIRDTMKDAIAGVERGVTGSAAPPLLKSAPLQAAAGDEPDQGRSPEAEDGGTGSPGAAPPPSGPEDDEA